ncbi:MAG: hypothetical protein LBC65_00815 [Oscillospiraceae bacterium]|nr:hypothetical protein [Oscillospiraceae bacterium]
MPTTWEELEMANQTERFEKVTRAEEARRIAMFFQDTLLERNIGKSEISVQDVKNAIAAILRQADEYRNI